MPKEGYKLFTVKEEVHAKAQAIAKKEKRSIAKSVSELVEKKHLEVISHEK